jgi:hypothetical protein
MPKGGLFIRLDLDFIDSPEIKRFSRKMQISVAEAIGMMCGVWRFAIRFRKDGILDNIHIEELAEEANYQGDPKDLVQRLVECELLTLTEDGHYLQVPEWESGVGFFLHQAKLNAERQRKVRESRVRNGDVTVTSRLCNGDVTVMSRPRLDSDPDLDPDPDPDPESEQESEERRHIAAALTPPVAVAPVSPVRKARKVKQPPDTAMAWEAYKAVLMRKHGIEPLRDQKANSIMCNLYKRIGADLPSVLEFYVMKQNSPLYLKGRHPLSLALLHIETIYGNWQAGREVTQTEANSIDKSMTNYNTLQALKEKYNGK